MQVYRFENKTNVVPMINVSLVVVLTLMIISPFLDKSEHEVELPEARAHQMDDTEKMEIIYTIDGEIFIGDQQYALEELKPLLTPEFEDNPDGMVVVHADKKLLYGMVETLLAEVESAKAPRIAIATSKREEGAATP